MSKVVYLGIDCILILVEDGLPWQYQHLRPIPPIECILVTLVQVLFLQDHQSVEKTNPWPSRPLARFRPSATKKTPNAIHPTRTSKTERKTPSRHVCILPAHHVDAVSTVSSLHVCIPFVTPCPPRYAAIAEALHCPVAEACVEEKSIVQEERIRASVIAPTLALQSHSSANDPSDRSNASRKRFSAVQRMLLMEGSYRRWSPHSECRLATERVLLLHRPVEQRTESGECC